jgi:hypothetical protein
MSLSKSRYIDYKQCPKKLWLNTYRRDLADEMDQSIFIMGTKVGELARDLFPGGTLVEYKEDDKNNIDRMIEETANLIEKGTEIIYEAAFSDGETLAICDIMVKDGDSYDVYEVKASTSVKDVHIKDLSFQYHVLNSCGIKVGSIYLVYINRLYTRRGDLDIFELFLAEDLTDIVKENENSIIIDLESTTEILSQSEAPCLDIGMYCDDPYTCQFKGHCFSHIPENSVFDVSGLYKHKKFDLYHKGIVSFNDIRDSGIRLSDKAMMQIDSELDDIEIVDREAIKQFVDSLWFPLYFLDFETIAPAVPQFSNTRPYQQTATQYSLHYLEKENGELFHKEFLAEPGTDPRREMAERLAKDIPRSACILAYNMTFEKGVIKDLANQFPDLYDALMGIYENVRDLMNPFKYKHIYKKEMQGSYSIKAVLPALFPDDPELSYDNLEGVHNGQEAQGTYAAMEDMTPEEQEIIKKQLLEYCKLDTLAMVRIWESF